MKKLILYILLLLFVLISGSVGAQDFEDDLVSWLEKHSKEELKSRLETIKKKYPNSAVLIFLEAYVEEDGDRAVDLYKQLVEKFPGSKFTSNALFKLAQYYYAVGSYVSARQYVDNLVDQFPGSPLVPEAKFLAARCLIATGYYVAAEEELKDIIKKYSKSPCKNYAKAELTSLNELEKQSINPPQSENVPTDFKQPIENFAGNGKYTIQIGAYQDKNNALKQKDLYSQQGYLASVETKYVNNSLLYLVWIGDFETEDQAARFGEVFKNLHGISFHVVKK
jgi:tetratricopeptide (TPR) repeat protein